MKTKNLIFNSLVIAAFCTTVLFNSCKKNETSQITNEATTFELDDNRIDEIQNITAIYNEEFGKVVNEELQDSRKSNYILNSEAIATKIDKNFNERIAALGLFNSTNKSGEIDYIPTEGFNLETYFNELNDMILAIEDGDKETSILKMQTTINNFIEIVKIDNSINDIEKQFVIENIVARVGMLLTVLEYSEEIEGLSGISDLKNAQRKCRWFCQYVQEKKCIGLSTLTLIHCGIAVGTLAPPATWFGVAMSAVCVAYANAAIKCWTDL